MDFQEVTTRFQSSRRSSTGTTHWNPRESLLVNSGVEHENDDENHIISPTSSITEHSGSVPLNVLKLAQGWQQKRQQEQLEQQQLQLQQETTDGDALNNHNLPESTGTNNNSDEDVVEQAANFPLIMEPKDLYDSDDAPSPDEVRELFIEMCFYARLGFVQPPCCLFCTYQESMEESGPNDHCSRLVVWRKNAETPIHPNQLDGNVCVMKCHVSRSLLDGRMVDGYAWDAANKQLIIASNEE